ncbi:MAG: hypothetical protein PUG71_07255 [bacterium]|nr:hypothetical protein [bacterium]
MSRNEVYDTLTKYGINSGGEITTFSDVGEIFKLFRFFEQGELVSFERPDAYIKAGNEILIIEHFAIDGYDTFGDGGSKLKRNENEMQKEFNKISATTDGVYVTKPLEIYNSYDGFLTNCKARFNHHYKQIESYKQNLLKKHVANATTKFTVCFLMDEISPLGTLTYDGEKICPVCLAKSKEFLEYFESMKDVDWIISAVVLSDGLKPYFFSQNEISECKKSVLDYAAFQFLSSNPMRADFKILIPNKE